MDESYQHTKRVLKELERKVEDDELSSEDAGFLRGYENAFE